MEEGWVCIYVAVIIVAPSHLYHTDLSVIFFLNARTYQLEFAGVSGVQ